MEELFLVTLPATGCFDEPFDGPLATLGERMKVLLVRRADEPMSKAYAALVRASDSAVIRRRLYHVVDVEFVD